MSRTILISLFRVGLALLWALCVPEMSRLALVVVASLAFGHHVIRPVAERVERWLERKDTPA